MSFLLALIFSPLLLGVINRTKAVFAGRRGAPLLQPYFDLWRLARKGVVYSATTTWVFRAGPVMGLAAALVAAALVPLGAAPSAVSFTGDLILFAYALGLMRFMTVLAALDTGSSFEGMGASREVWFSALAEPALLLGLVAVARQTGAMSLSEMATALSAQPWRGLTPALLSAAGAFFVVFLVENARIPFDDPNTHLELTMIHEVMVLDHSGPDFGLIQYGAALKLWTLGALLVSMLAPIRAGAAWSEAAVGLVAMLALAVSVGVIESTMARLRLTRVPNALIGAGALAALALILTLR
jgi:formate hydrogenlyase subunit 4